MDAAPQPARRQSRLSRLLTFGDVLDESMLLFRCHWITFAAVSAVSLLPPGLVFVWLGAAGLMSGSLSIADLQNGRLADPTVRSAQLAVIAAALVYGLVYSLFGLLWSAAVVVTTDAYQVGQVKVDDSMAEYLVAIGRATRTMREVQFGASVRGALGMLHASKALATFADLDYVTPDDIKSVAAPVLRHRIFLKPEAELDGLKPDNIVQRILTTVAVPR